MSKKVPQIRFNGYSDAWEERKLGDLGSVAMNKRIFKEQTSDVGDIPFYKIGTFGGTPDAFISRDIFEEYKSKYQYPEVGDILISASGSIGRTVVYQGYDEYFQDSNIVWLKHDQQLDNSFLKQFYSIVKWQGLEGSTIKRLYNKNILETKITLPSPEEQAQLGSFFKQLDDTIALHQRKLDLLKEQKKGYLQKMFPKNGAKVPELRFAGFADDWEERKLGDHAKYRRGSFPQPYGNKEWYDGEGAMPFVQVVDVTNKLTLVENTKQKISKLAQSKSVFVPKGKVVVTLQGSIGRVAITQYDSFVDRTLLIFENYEKETDERFWAYTIQKKFEIEKLKAPGGTIKTITKEALSSFDVHLPKFEEQQKIGSFFRQLDETIALHQRKLELLKEQKKGFLQKMFV